MMIAKTANHTADTTVSTGSSTLPVTRAA